MERLTADDINTAIDIAAKRRARWEKAHEGEKMEECPKCKGRGVYRRCFTESGVELFGEDMNKPGSYDYFYPCECVGNTKDNQRLRNNKKFASVPALYVSACQWYAMQNRYIYNIPESQYYNKRRLPEAPVPES